jgi:hypothetical protein
MSRSANSERPYPWFAVIGMTSVMVGGLALLVYHSCTSQKDIRDDGHAYFQALREGRLDDAYRLLATETRQQVSREAFETKLYTPKLRQASDASFYDVNVSSSGHGCLQGGITIGDQGESFYVYMRQEGPSWRVHSITFESYLNDPRWRWCR